MAKAGSIIAAEDVDRVFHDEQIAELATIAKLPADADRQRFAQGIRDAVRIYARDAREPTDNDLHREIKELHGAADRRRYDQLAALAEGLSPKARNSLNTRGARLGVMLPSPEALRGAQREEACAAIVKLTQFGGEYRKGRKRPGGKRSRTWQPLLYAPQRQRNFPKREAERDFTMWLAAAYGDAVGQLPARTADSRAPGPFARMVGECLRLVGAPNASAVELINELHRAPAAKRRRRQLKAHAAKERKHRVSRNKP
jgi:hypothetical protein